MRRVAALAVALVLAAGCTSSGSGRRSSPAPSSSAGSSTVAPGALRAKLAGLTSLTSVAVAASTTVSGSTIAGNGHAQLSGGTIVAGDITQALPGGLGSIRVVRAGGKTYAKVPAALLKTSRPWLLLDAGSSNPVISQLAGLVTTVLAVASPSSLVSFADAATSIRDLGGGHYAMQVDTAKLPSALSTGLGGAGTIPVELYLDAQNRPTRIRGTFPIAGAPVTTTITLSDFDAPVTITAPPATQVGSK